MRYLVFGFMLLIAQPGLGQETKCQLDDTISACWAKWNPKTITKTVTPEDRKKSLGDAVLAKLTGVDAQDSTLGSGAKDFLNLFAATVENAQFAESENSLDLTWNLADQFQLQAKLHEAVVYKPIQEALDKASRSDAAKTLEKEFDDLSDITIAASYGLQTKRFGRKIEPHTPLAEKLFHEVTARVTGGPDSLTHDKLLEVIQEIYQPLPGEIQIFRNSDSLNTLAGLVSEARRAGHAPDTPTAQPELESIRAEVLARVEEAAKADKKLNEDLTKAVNNDPIASFSNLLNNQPQLSFTIKFRNRDEAIGPDEFGAEITYEKGLYNLNWLRRKLREGGYLGACDTPSQESTLAKCLEGFQDFVEGRKNIIDDANRFTFKASYNEVDAYDFTLPGSDDGMQAPVMVSEEKIKKLIASVAYGRVLTLDEAGEPVSRFDLEAKYEDIMDGKTMVDNRFIVTAIYTRQLTDSLSLPLSLVWANKDEFLPEVDEKFSANFGIRFRVKGKDQGGKDGGGSS